MRRANVFLSVLETLTRLYISIVKCKSLPFYCRWRFRADVVTYSVHTSDFIDDVV